MHTQICVWVPAFNSLGFIPRSGISGSYGNSAWFLRNCHVIFQGPVSENTLPPLAPHSYSALCQTQRDGVDENNEFKLWPQGIERATENTTLPERPLNEDPNCPTFGGVELWLSKAWWCLLPWAAKAPSPKPGRWWEGPHLCRPGKEDGKTHGEPHSQVQVSALPLHPIMIQCPQPPGDWGLVCSSWHIYYYSLGS